jgi:hypothetical protein
MNGSSVPLLFGTVISTHAADEPWTTIGSLIAALIVIAVVGFAVGLIIVVGGAIRAVLVALLRDTKGLPIGKRVLSVIGRFFCFVVGGAGLAVLVALLLLLQFWVKSRLGIDIPIHHVPDVFRK